MKEATPFPFFFILTLLIALSIIATAIRYLLFSDFAILHYEEEIPVTPEEHLNYLKNKGL